MTSPSPTRSSPLSSSKLRQLALASRDLPPSPACSSPHPPFAQCGDVPFTHPLSPVELRRLRRLAPNPHDLPLRWLAQLSPSELQRALPACPCPFDLPPLPSDLPYAVTFPTPVKNDGGSKEDHGGLLVVRMPDDIDVSMTFNNWLFALEGTRELGGVLLDAGDNLSREERCWHTTFQSLHLRAKSNSESNCGNNGRLGMKRKFPVESITVGIEGLQALKPSAKDINGVERDLTNGNINTSGVDAEVFLLAFEDDSAIESKWIAENVKFSVKQPIEAVATREELEHLASLCKSEVDSMGRIAAGILRLLKLDKSLGRAVDQLSNLGELLWNIQMLLHLPNISCLLGNLLAGSGSMHKILTPARVSRRNSFGSTGFTPRTPTSSPRLNDNVESTITSLEIEILDLQSKCSTLISDLRSSDCSQHVSDVQYLTDKLESLQNLLTRLRALI